MKDQSGPWCWNCCDTAKCSDQTHRSRHLGNAKFIDCQPVTGAYRKDGKVVSPGMVQEGLYFGKASYVCEEKCTMTLDWSGTPTRTTGSVFRGGGVENSRCVYERIDDQGSEVTAEHLLYEPGHVTATEKSTGKSNQMTISNDKGRLSQAEIEQMIQASCGDGLAGSNELPSSEEGYGRANAARVSRGSVEDYWPGLATQPRRDEKQHCTITVQFYHTVTGGVPSPQDVLAAIDDMEQLYTSCDWQGRLAEQGANFMKV
ncbi:unnamed protein product [Effrenium voratum]|nr:unnamed protein product [Effrenium voratum]